MADIFPASGLTTERAAINSMLNACGEAALEDTINLETYTAPDFIMARDILRGTLTKCLTEGWKFNTDWAVAHASLDPGFLWQPTNTAIAVFSGAWGMPGNYPVIKWKLSEVKENRGLDLVEFMSSQFTYSGSPVPVLVDRKNHRDGPLASRYPVIYLDLTYQMPFLELPQTAREYIVAVSSRMLAGRLLGSSERSALTEGDELSALRLLRKEHGIKERKNALDNPSIALRTGRYPRRAGRTPRRVYNEQE